MNKISLRILEYLYSQSDEDFHPVNIAFKDSSIKPNRAQLGKSIDELGDLVVIKPTFHGIDNEFMVKISSKGVDYINNINEKKEERSLKKKDLNVRWWHIAVILLIPLIGFICNQITEHPKPLKMMEITSQYQLIKLILKNSDPNPRYIKNFNLIIHDRDSLVGLISPYFTQPNENDIIHIELLENTNNYRIKPILYIDKNNIESFNFNLFHHHYSPEREFMKLQFEITDDLNFTILSDTIIHYVGETNPLLYQDSTSLLYYSKLNDLIVEEYSNNNMYKTNQAKEIIKNYKLNRSNFSFIH